MGLKAEICFQRIGPLADSFIEPRCPSVCPLPMQFFSRPLIGPYIRGLSSLALALPSALPSAHYHLRTTICATIRATIRALPSAHYHLRTTICALPSAHYHLLFNQMIADWQKASQPVSQSVCRAELTMVELAPPRFCTSSSWPDLVQLPTTREQAWGRGQ